MEENSVAEEKLELKPENVVKFAFEDFPKEPYFCAKLPAKFLKYKGALPVSLDGNTLKVVLADTEDIDTLDAIRQVTGFELTVFKGRREDIEAAIDRIYSSDQATVEKIVGDITPDDFGTVKEEDIDHLRDMASEAPVIRLVNLIVTRAIEGGASDIHFEPFEDSFRVRFRVDDILKEVESLPLVLHAAVSSRIKIMANLNIAERRLPQDGRIKIAISGRDVDIRVATMPTSFGESIVLRILDRNKLVLNLTDMGLSSQSKTIFDSMIAKPYGMLLVTGPTGSGKTTTLYTTLDKLNSPDKKIVTIEDPVEYNLFGVNQIQVKPHIGLDFASGLRHILRLDPNIVMVGEIRDKETAEITIQSALTGHLVFSTLHTNDAAGSIVRLLEMGVPDFLLASSLIGVIAQRLVRKICLGCKVSYKPGERDFAFIKEINVSDKRELLLYKGEGCDECTHTGYSGRTGIFELLHVGSEIENLILKNPDTGHIKKKAKELGMKTLREDGFTKAIEGITTLDEVIRVTRED